MRGWWILSLLTTLSLGACRPEPELQYEEIITIGDSAATALTTALMSRVRAELEAGGPGHAIAFCSERALPITAAVQDSIDRGIALKRTSRKIRNPANAPDSLELIALDYFEEELRSGRELSPAYVQRTDEGWRYYKPIVVAEFCTACHGPREALAPDVQQVLTERYPQDQATGYAPGDFRGVIRVTLTGEAVSP